MSKLPFRKKPLRNYHGISDKFFIQKEKKSTELPWAMSAKSDTQLPGFIYNEIKIFFNRL